MRTNITREVFLSGRNVYKIKDNELYSNLSQNYRSVTFSDISVVNPAFMIDPNISDEYGQTFDLGFRGKYIKLFLLILHLFF